MIVRITAPLTCVVQRERFGSDLKVTTVHLVEGLPPRLPMLVRRQQQPVWRCCAEEDSGERIARRSLYRVQYSVAYMDMGTFSV